ncbi:MAG TPA: flagellar filament capping protein FliD, partial [Candidatus Binataceae bacterium]|nr:flagellar filament capping protein FliD [Candidatus Binataceae bacterium]
GAVSQGYQFTVTSGGTVGTDPITISYTSASGESGTINVPAGYTAGSPLTVADGLTLSLGAGTLNTGDQFSVGVFVPQVSSAQNAEVQVGTEVISSSTNNVTGAIPGVTLQLTNTGGPATVTVASDDNALATQVSNFVSAYNTLISDINTNTQAIPNQTPPPLAADGGLRMELFSLQSALGTINLSNLGITVNQADGSLSFNQTALLTAEASNSSGVTQALGQLYSAINPEVTGALDPNTGVIAAETSSYNSQITDLNNQIATLNQQLQAEQANLQTEFGQIQAEVESYQNISQLFTDNSSSSSGSGGSSIPLPGSNLTVSA